MLSSNEVTAIANKQTPLSELQTEQLVAFLTLANSHYRAGTPLISDSDYDFIFLAELQRREPAHPYLQAIESEEESFGNKLLLPEPMLSTDKAYSVAEIVKFIERLAKAATEINLDSEIILRATPKLDGFAAYDDGTTLYTRGDGKKGSDITRAFTRGLLVYGDADRGLGAGEIVIKRSYFDTHLSTQFEHPRNFTASIIKEKALDEHTKQAIHERAAYFVPFATLPKQEHTTEYFLEHFSTITDEVSASVDFDTDGVVIEAIHPELRSHMGANRKFHRYQIAFKANTESNQVEVLEVVPQVGRTGKITPVAILEPSMLSGATITHATCHHYGMVKQDNIGPGSKVELVRSGQVIPKITKVITATQAIIPSHCPSCNSELTWHSDFLMCTNHSGCRDQGIGRLEYFFKILGNNDGFGRKTLEKLYDAGHTTISSMYNLTPTSLTSMGFGPKISQNLIEQLGVSRSIQIEDYRLLSAFGVERLGLGNSENLLGAYPLSDIFTLSEAEIAAIDGFGEITAQSIVSGLLSIRVEFEHILSLGFNLEYTKAEDLKSSLFTGKYIVFSGSMSLPREEIEKTAKSYGIKVQKSVNAKTDYLVIGEKVGQSKLTKASSLSVEILPYADYKMSLV